jgi:uncharacterized LabA/DUF88 family protein
MSEPEFPPPALRRATFLFDGQNVVKGIRDIFGVTRWNADPKKLAQLVAGRIGVSVHEVRFYTGYPKWDRHYDMRAFWERKLAEYRQDGVITEFRELRYRGKDDDKGREKGIDVLIALDALQAVIDGDVDDIVIFSQDNDLGEVPGRATKFLDRELARVGVRRGVRFFSAFPHEAAKEAEARAWVEGQGERPRVNFRGINGGYRWVRLRQADFEACPDDREAALAAQKVDLPGVLARLASERRKPVRDYDVAAAGGYISGTVAAVLRLPSRGVIVFETTADLLAVKVCDRCLPEFDQATGKMTHAHAERQNGEVFLKVSRVEG